MRGSGGTCPVRCPTRSADVDVTGSEFAAHPAVKIVGMVKRIGSRLTEGWSATDDGIFCEGPRRARIAPFLLDVLGGLSAP